MLSADRTAVLQRSQKGMAQERIGTAKQAVPLRGGDLVDVGKLTYFHRYSMP